MQALPFDWRFDPVWQSEFHKKFKLVAKKLKNITGKKSALVAHSNGNILTYYSMEMFWSKEDKGALLNNYVSISPPYMGSIMIIRFLLGGTDWMTKGPFGFGYESALKITAKAPLMMQSLLTPVYNREGSEEFLEVIGKHLKYEKSFVREGDKLVQGKEADGKLTDKGISFWPSPMEVCKKFINFNDTDYCTSALFDPLGMELVKIKEEVYKYEDLKALLCKESYLKEFEHAWSYYYNPKHINFEKKTPPTGIPTILVYTSVLPTENEAHFNEHPYKISKEENRAYYPDWQGYKRGDGRVASSSSLLTTLKWAWLYDHQKIGAPVKFVELCSSHNNKVSPYDHKFLSHFANSDYIRDRRPGVGKNSLSKTKELLAIGKSDGELKIEKNEYIGVRCDCISEENLKKEGFQKTEESKSCHHINMHRDTGFLYFMANTVLTSQRSEYVDPGTGEILESKMKFFEDQSEVDDFLEKCELLTSDSEVKRSFLAHRNCKDPALVDYTRKMKVVIIGATGATGRELVRNLARNS
jgi:hypothetical protein